MGNLHHIEIRRLQVLAQVGVPDEELAVPQELRVSVTISIFTPFAEMADDLEKTLDYAALATGIQALAADGTAVVLTAHGDLPSSLEQVPQMHLEHGQLGPGDRQ